MRHPDQRQIALYAGGEAGWVERFSIRHHLNQCTSCSELAQRYLADRATIREEAGSLPGDLDWNRLASEMTANIRVGLEAGECVNGVRLKPHRIIAWRPALAAAGLAVVLMSGWYLKVPSQQRESLSHNLQRIWNRSGSIARPGVSLEATRNGIQLTENGSTLTMMHPGAAPALVVVSTRGALRARYVDDDTGQVTITNVYAQ